MTDVYRVLLQLTLISSNHFNSVCNSSLTPSSCRLWITEWLISRANNRKNSFDVDGYSLTTFCSGQGHNDTHTHPDHTHNHTHLQSLKQESHSIQ